MDDETGGGVPGLESLVLFGLAREGQVSESSFLDRLCSLECVCLVGERLGRSNEGSSGVGSGVERCRRSVLGLTRAYLLFVLVHAYLERPTNGLEKRAASLAWSRCD